MAKRTILVGWSQWFQTISLWPVEWNTQIRTMKTMILLAAEGVKVASVLNTAPLLCSHRTSAIKPAPTSNILPDASGPSGWQTAATNGATNSGYAPRSGFGVWHTCAIQTFRLASISGGITVSVMAEAAIWMVVSAPKTSKTACDLLEQWPPTWYYTLNLQKPEFSWNRSTPSWRHCNLPDRSCLTRIKYERPEHRWTEV